MFILDYNQAREYDTLSGDDDELKNTSTMEIDNAKNDEAMIYIEILCK